MLFNTVFSARRMPFLLSSRMIFDSQAWRSLKCGLCSCVLSSSLLTSLYGPSVCPVQCLPNWNSSIKFDQPSQIFNTTHLLTHWAQYPLEELWSGQIRGHQLAWVKMLWMMWPDTCLVYEDMRYSSIRAEWERGCGTSLLLSDTALLC